jgi:type I restriction-modification system DNA methylase subunit
MNNLLKLNKSKKLYLNNIKKLSKLIDKYLIPQELEKKKNAEISTPYQLRKDMLDKMPLEFWKNKNKVFEPCCGKGGFLIDIVDRFMDGLKDTIENKKERYKIIIEKLLYWSDINSTNIFICKLLLDPYNEYKLNYNEGDTLKLDIKQKWNIKNFDAVIGNPPYNDASNNKGSGHKIWDKFMFKLIEDWIKKNGYLIYVHPPLWRQPYTKLFEIVKKYNLIYIEIHNEKDGNKMFKKDFWKEFI